MNSTTGQFTAILSFIIASLQTVEAQNSSNMQINQNAPVKQQNQIQINASPAKVWAVLTDINNWTKWNDKISKSHMQGGWCLYTKRR